MKIQNDEEYDVAVKEMDALLDREGKGEDLSQEEQNRLIELSNAVEAYDDLHHNPPFGD